jgi:DNA repair protein RecN (Recombination protein N)
MLAHLSVLNLAVLESVKVEFSEGLNIITGETGAGKSVLMNALALVLGARSDAEQVRDGAREARIDAVFDLSKRSDTASKISFLLEDLGLPPCENGELVLRRSILATGGGRVYINDSASTVQTLKNIGKLLVDKHGPSDHQSLQEESFQRSLLDSFAGFSSDSSSIYSSYKDAWNSLHSLRMEKQSLMGDSVDVAAECEMLNDAVSELENAHLSEDDETDLVERHAAAAHAAEILENANFVTMALTGDDDTSASTALIIASNKISEMAKYHIPAEDWSEEIESLTIRVQELSRSIADSVSRIDADPEVLQALDERISLIQRLKRKYARHNICDLITLLEEKKSRLQTLLDRDMLIEQIDIKIKEAEKDVEKAGKNLSDLRKRAAEKFSKAVTKELHGLGFLKSDFKVAVSEKTPDATGCDTIEFLFAPNPGESERPLKDIASTGETARVMLAVKAVAAEHDSIPVLIFDEIDSNIGGEVGKAVGERLRSVSKHHQVISITHLPQSAVYGETHFVVSKSVSNGRTHSTVENIENENRIAEIARMLGGSSLTSVVMQHAKELISIAQK